MSLLLASYLLIFHSDEYTGISKSNLSIISSRASRSILMEDTSLHSYISKTYRDPYPPTNSREAFRPYTDLELDDEETICLSRAGFGKENDLCEL